MSFFIVKVRSSLNYSLIGLKIKYIYGGIKGKIEEILIKYIEMNCVNCYYFHDPRRRICDTTNVRLTIDLQKLIMQRVIVQRETTFAQFAQLRTPSYCGFQCNEQHLRSMKNGVILQIPVQRATLSQL